MSTDSQTVTIYTTIPSQGGQSQDREWGGDPSQWSHKKTHEWLQKNFEDLQKKSNEMPFEADVTEHANALEAQRSAKHLVLLHETKHDSKVSNLADLFSHTSYTHRVQAFAAC
jgi:hypothetical protein